MSILYFSNGATGNCSIFYSAEHLEFYKMGFFLGDLAVGIMFDFTTKN